jgi:hypothetical protein
MTKRAKVTTRRKTAAIAAGAVKIHAGQVKDLLVAKFSEEHFCTAEIGLNRGVLCADFMAIRPSHSNPSVIIGEVKCSRADFLQDNKWPGYLPFCTRFYMVTAPGVATRDEIGADAGWLEVTANGAKLITRKAAPVLRHELEPKNEATVLRSIVHRHFYGTHRDPTVSGEERAAFWRDFVATRKRDKLTGHQASRAIREHLLRADKAVYEAQLAVEAFTETERILADLGIPRDRAARGRKHAALANDIRNALAKEFGAGGKQEAEDMLRAVRSMNRSITTWANQVEAGMAEVVKHFVDAMKQDDDQGS